MAPFSYASYLAAKRTIDDRALNQHVLGVLRQELRKIAGAPTVLDLGAGTGAMVDRLADRGVLTRARYVLVDADRGLLDEAAARLTSWAETLGCSVTTAGDVLSLRGGQRELDLQVRRVCADVFTFLDGPVEPVDVLIANAFLDLVDVPATLPAILSRLAPDGLYWFSINFDGETILLPEHALDAQLIGVYHRSMDVRIRAGRRAGDSRTGRHLFQHLPSSGATILASGSSDWVVHAIDGEYRAEERAFLENILSTMHAELEWRDEVDKAGLEAWLATRREQAARAELVYIAHQLDFVGRCSASSGPRR